MLTGAQRPLPHLPHQVPAVGPQVCHRAAVDAESVLSSLPGGGTGSWAEAAGGALGVGVGQAGKEVTSVHIDDEITHYFECQTPTWGSSCRCRCST